MLFASVVTAMLASQLTGCRSVLKAGTCQRCPVQAMGKFNSANRFRGACVTPVVARSCQNDMERLIQGAKESEYSEMQLTDEAEEMMEDIRASVAAGNVQSLDTAELQKQFKELALVCPRESADKKECKEATKTYVASVLLAYIIAVGCVDAMLTIPPATLYLLFVLVLPIDADSKNQFFTKEIGDAYLAVVEGIFTLLGGKAAIRLLEKIDDGE